MLSAEETQQERLVSEHGAIDTQLAVSAPCSGNLVAVTVPFALRPFISG
jgi:hypothetical protein